MTLTETAINGVFEIEPKLFGDNRGWFYESYSKEKFEKLGFELRKFLFKAVRNSHCVGQLYGQYLLSQWG